MFRTIFGRFFGKRKCDDGVRPESSAPGPVRPEMLIFGLGNPGGRYDRTRHNIGFDVVEEFSALCGGGLSAPGMDCKAECLMVAAGSAKRPVLLAKPMTYMNLSGDAVSALVGKYGLTAADCLVIVDDFDIPLGRIRFRKDGSPGGHNGLKSITAAIGASYPRLRVGVGPLPVGVTIVDFVLARFDRGEREHAAKVVKTAAEAVVFMVGNGIDAAMNKYNNIDIAV